MSIVVGKVTMIIGSATAISADGTIRQLKVGDEVYQGEVISTADHSGISVMLNDGSTSDLGRNSQVLSDDLNALASEDIPVEAYTDSANPEEEVLQLFGEGSSQSLYLSNQLEFTGVRPDAETDTTLPGVTDEMSREVGDAINFFDESFLHGGVANQSALILPVQHSSSQPGPDQPNYTVDITEGLFPTFNEADLAHGSDVDPSNLTDSGQFYINAPDGLKSISIDGMNVFHDGITESGSFTLESGNSLKINSITVDAHGKYIVDYEFTLNNPLNHTDGSFTFFNVSAHDKNGDISSAKMGVRVDDSAPLASLSSGSEPGYQLSITNLGDTLANHQNAYGVYFKGENGEPVSGIILFSDTMDLTHSTVVLNNVHPDDIGFFLIPAPARPADFQDMDEVTFELGADGYYMPFINGAPIEMNAFLKYPHFSDPKLNYNEFNSMVYESVAGKQIWETTLGGGTMFYYNGNYQVNFTQSGGATLNLDDPGSPVVAVVDISDRFETVSADGIANESYKFTINNSIDSGLIDAATGESISLRYFNNDPDSGVIEGFFFDGSSNVVVFSAGLTDGELSINQYRQVGTSDDVANPYINLVSTGNGAITITYTVTDADGDTSSAEIDFNNIVTMDNDYIPAGNVLGPLVSTFGNPLGNILHSTSDNQNFRGMGGNDTFSWGAGTDGTAKNPGFDRVADFSADILDFSDLLQGEENGDISDFIRLIEREDMFIELMPNGDGEVTQIINIQNKTASDLGIGGFDLSLQQNEAINQLISNGTVVVDQG